MPELLVRGLLGEHLIDRRTAHPKRRSNRDEQRFHRRLARVAALDTACLAVALADRVIRHAMCEPPDYRSASLAAIWPTMATAAGRVWL